MPTFHYMCHTFAEPALRFLVSNSVLQGDSYIHHPFSPLQSLQNLRPAIPFTAPYFTGKSQGIVL